MSTKLVVFERAEACLNLALVVAYLAVHSDVYLGPKQVQGAFEMKLSSLHEMTVAIAGETPVEASLDPDLPADASRQLDCCTYKNTQGCIYTTASLPPPSEFGAWRT